MACTSSPRPGTFTTSTRSACSITDTSDCPTPTVSTRIRSYPQASKTWMAPALAGESPPSCPRVPMERMNTPSSKVRSLMRTRSPRIAPPEKGLVGSMAMTPTRSPFLRQHVTNAFARVLLPAPGGPVRPNTLAPPVMGQHWVRTDRASSPPRSTALISRAAARLFPARPRASSSPLSCVIRRSRNAFSKTPRFPRWACRG